MREGQEKKKRKQNNERMKKELREKEKKKDETLNKFANIQHCYLCTHKGGMRWEREEKKK